MASAHLGLTVDGNKLVHASILLFKYMHVETRLLIYIHDSSQKCVWKKLW